MRVIPYCKIRGLKIILLIYLQRYCQQQVGYLIYIYSVIESSIGVNVIILVLSEVYSHTMKVKHLKEELHHSKWFVYQSKSAYIRERIDIYLG